MSEAEMDENGFIEYEKFAPQAAVMVRSLWDQNQDEDRALFLEETVKTGGDTIFGRDRQEVYDTTLSAFHEFDADSNGVLSSKEFKKCLMQTELLGRPLT